VSADVIVADTRFSRVILINACSAVKKKTDTHNRIRFLRKSDVAQGGTVVRSIRVSSLRLYYTRYSYYCYYFHLFIFHAHKRFPITQGRISASERLQWILYIFLHRIHYQLYSQRPRDG